MTGWLITLWVTTGREMVLWVMMGLEKAVWVRTCWSLPKVVRLESWVVKPPWVVKVFKADSSESE